MFNSVGSLQTLTRIDLLVLALIVIALPIFSHVMLKLNPVEKIRNEPGLRLTSYNWTLFELWGIGAAVLVAWTAAGRPFAALGFRHEGDLATIAVWSVVAVALALNLAQLLQVQISSSARKKMRQELDALGELTSLMMPRTAPEYRRGLMLGITAGVAEEVIFRGYLIWALSQFFNLWIAGALSVALFVFLHRYQDRAGLLQVSIFAAVATSLFLISGSLWPVIVLHVGVDVCSVSLSWMLRAGNSDQEHEERA